MHPGWVQVVGMAMSANSCGGLRHRSEEVLGARGQASCLAAVLQVSPRQARDSSVFLAPQTVMWEDEAKRPFLEGKRLSQGGRAQAFTGEWGPASGLSLVR